MDSRPARRAGADLNSNSDDMELSGLIFGAYDTDC